MKLTAAEYQEALNEFVQASLPARQRNDIYEHMAREGCQVRVTGAMFYDIRTANSYITARENPRITFRFKFVDSCPKLVERNLKYGKRAKKLNLDGSVPKVRNRNRFPDSYTQYLVVSNLSLNSLLKRIVVE